MKTKISYAFLIFFLFLAETPFSFAPTSQSNRVNVMFGPFVHNIDPIIFSIFGVHFWWYGLSFTLGFLSTHFFLRRNRERVGLSLPAVYDLTLFLAVGVLIGGRALVVINNEWDFYREHLLLIPSIWVGGFATHGLIFGGAAGVIIFCLIRRAPLRRISDLLAISAAVIMGFGRIGNFIDAQIFGSLTDVAWGVKFPHVEGFRHPVVLYDGLKNFLLAPFLLWARKFGGPPGRLAGLFIFLYALFRIPIDTLREYPISMWGLPTGQTLNIITVLIGIILLSVNICLARSHQKSILPIKTDDNRAGLGWRRLALAACCIIPLVIPSDATRDVPATYGERHSGLKYSWMYPPIALDLAKSATRAAAEDK
jgi:phosphatidylglycerol:prolipoprotein diacylglycerol transferase